MTELFSESLESSLARYYLYEYKKRNLEARNLSPEEYECELKKLADEIQL